MNVLSQLRCIMTQISVHTADGMLTRATITIPPGNRARKITVNSQNKVSGKTITVSITPNTILSFFSPTTSIEQGVQNGLLYNQKIHGRDRGFRWYGWAWVFTNTQEWTQTPFHILEREAIQATTLAEAVVEHLRYILNKELRIRPLITEKVCVEVTNLLATKKESQCTFVGVRTKSEDSLTA